MILQMPAVPCFSDKAKTSQHMQTTSTYSSKGVLQSLGVFLGRGFHKLLHMLLNLVEASALPLWGTALLRSFTVRHCDSLNLPAVEHAQLLEHGLLLTSEVYVIRDNCDILREHN